MRRRPWFVVATVLIAVLWPTPSAAATGGSSLLASPQPEPLAWEQWQHQVGIVDLGIRADGTLVAMAAGHLFLIQPTSGAAAPFSTGPNGFSADPNVEPYFVVAQAQAVDNTSCAWNADDLFILDLTSPPGIARVDPSGQSSRFATLPGVDTLGGIALDTVGRFGHRLLVTGTHDGNQTTVFALDCQGSSTVLTTSAPKMEGGPAVAPSSFGQFAGDLVAPDEDSGQIWAVDPSGKATLLMATTLPSGGDTGVESEGFVPSGFIADGDGFAYLSDRGTPNNPFPGTDSILRLSSTSLAPAGVEDGDLLVSTEGNGTTLAIRCTDTCGVVATIQGTNGGHIEGHITFLKPKTPPLPETGRRGGG